MFYFNITTFSDLLPW